MSAYHKCRMSSVNSEQQWTATAIGTKGPRFEVNVQWLRHAQHMQYTHTSDERSIIIFIGILSSRVWPFHAILMIMRMWRNVITFDRYSVVSVWTSVFWNIFRTNSSHACAIEIFIEKIIIIIMQTLLAFTIFLGEGNGTAQTSPQTLRWHDGNGELNSIRNKIQTL